MKSSGVMLHGTASQSNLTTLCYIEKDDKYLMMHRVKKENDVNQDKNGSGWGDISSRMKPRRNACCGR